MAINNENVLFKYGLKANFQTLDPKDQNSIYFVADAQGASHGDLYVGSTCFSGAKVQISGSGKFVVGASYDEANRALTLTLGDAVYGTGTGGIKSAVDAALQEALADYVEGVAAAEGSAISVDNTDAQNPVVGLNLDNSGNVKLSQSASGLKANINVADLDIPEAGIQGVLTGDEFLYVDGSGVGSNIDLRYDSAAKQIQLWGNSTVSPVATIDATSFIKDGMVSSASYANGIISLTFNSDGPSEPIEIDVSDLVNTYEVAQNGGLVLDGNAFSIDNTVTPSAGVNKDNGVDLQFGQSTTVQTIKYNDKGLITGAETFQMTLPSLPSFAAPTGSVGGTGKLVSAASLSAEGLTGSTYDVVSSVDSSSTGNQIPSAAAVYNQIQSALPKWEVFEGATPTPGE